MKINLEEGKVKCYERKNIRTLGRVGRELSDNTKNAAAIAQIRTSGVRPDVRSISEKYLNRNKKGKHRTARPSWARVVQ